MTSKRWLLFGLGLVVSGFFVALTLRRVEFSSLLASISTVSVPWLLAAACCKVGAFAALTARAQVLFYPRYRFTMFRQLRGVLVGFVGNNVLPFRIGELMRVGYLVRSSDLNIDTVVATVALERLLDLFCLMLIFMCVLPLMVVELEPSVYLWALAGLLILTLAAAFAMSIWPSYFVRLSQWFTSPLPSKLGGFVTRRVEGFAQGLAALASPVLVLGALATSMAYWGIGLMSVQFLLWSFGLSLPWYAPLAVLVFLAFGTMLPAAPGFVGTYHYFAASALALFAVPEGVAVSFGIVSHAMAFLPWTLLAIPIVMSEFVPSWSTTQASRRA